MTIEQRIIKIVAAEVGTDPAGIGRDSRFADLDCNDIGRVEIVMDVEDEFDLLVPDSAMEQMTTVGMLIDYITEKTTAAKT